MAKARHNRAPTKTTPSMRLDVENFGPIAKGRVDLRPLTVFAGPSNTGKSWLATLIYVMERHRRMENFSSISFSKYRRPAPEASEVKEDFGITEEHFPRNPEKWIKNLKDSGKVNLTTSEIETVRKALKPCERDIERELLRCYGISKPSDLIRKNHRGKTQLTALLGQVKHRMGLGRKSGEVFSLDIGMPDTVVLDTNQAKSRNFRRLPEYLDQLTMDRNQPTFWYSSSRYAYRIIEMITGVLFESQDINNVYYFPADRGGIMRAHSVVVDALINNASRAGLRSNPPLPILSGVLGDFLEQLLRIAEYSSRERYQNDQRHGSSENLEGTILRGMVEVEKGDLNYPRFVYRPEGWKIPLPLMNASSMVSELAPIALYLRYLVNPGDLLIIEEPETNLHPAMQREFTHQIALWVRSGIQVLLTTHSEWVLEEIANIVARGEMKKDNGSDVAALAKEDVGVWLFEPANKNKPMAGSKIKEMPWKPDEGGYVADFDKVAIELHNEWANLMSEVS